MGHRHEGVDYVIKELWGRGAQRCAEEHGVQMGIE